MIKVHIEKVIKDCSQCPACYTCESDCGMHTYDFFCQEAGQYVAKGVWIGEQLPEFPDWCPCKIEDIIVKDTFDYEVGQAVFRIDEADGKLQIKEGRITERYVLETPTMYGPFYVLADDRWLHRYSYRECDLFATAEQAERYLLSLNVAEKLALLTFLVKEHGKRK